MKATKSPFDDNHRIGRLEVVAAVHDLDSAMDYRPQLESLVWEKFPEIMDRVFDKYAPPDSIFRMGELQLDLGTIRPAFLEIDAIAALEQALDEALSGAVHDARHSQQPDHQLIDTPVWRLQRMEAFLCDGTPGFIVDLASFDPDTEVIWLLDHEPDPFLAMLRRRGGHRYVLERLYLQTSETARNKLLDQLAPAHAADIRASMEEVAGLLTSSQLTHSSLPLPKFWTQTVAYLLRGTGSLLDLNHFLKEVLAAMAQQANMALPELVSALHGADLATIRRSHRHSGLGEVLEAMTAELSGELPGIVVPETARIAAAGNGQLHALLKAWSPDDRIREKSQILARLFSQTSDLRAAAGNKIDRAIFEYIAARTEKAEDRTAHEQLWKYVLAKFEPTNGDPQRASDIIQILLSDSTSAEQQIAAILDASVHRNADFSRQSHGSIDSKQQSASAATASHGPPPATDNDRPADHLRNADHAAFPNLNADIIRAMATGGPGW